MKSDRPAQRGLGEMGPGNRPDARHWPVPLLEDQENIGLGKANEAAHPHSQCCSCPSTDRTSTMHGMHSPRPPNPPKYTASAPFSTADLSWGQPPAALPGQGRGSRAQPPGLRSTAGAFHMDGAGGPVQDGHRSPAGANTSGLCRGSVTTAGCAASGWSFCEPPAAPPACCCVVAPPAACSPANRYSSGFFRFATASSGSGLGCRTSACPGRPCRPPCWRWLRRCPACRRAGGGAPLPAAHTAGMPTAANVKVVKRIWDIGVEALK